MNTSKIHILGIDISKNHFDVALLVDNNKQKNKKFTNNLKGFRELKSWLEKHSVINLHACMEATNIYGNALAEYLYDANYHVSIVNPARIKGFAQSELLRTKTDKQDAGLIARFCVAMQPTLWEPEPKKVRELKALVRRMDSLVEMKQQETNRLKVAESIVSEDIEEHIQSLSKKIEQLREKITDHIDNDPDLRKQKQLLLSIPGIGEKTIAILLSYFSSIQKFSHAKKLAAFCGVTPKVCDSGSSISKYRRLSKVGASDLRKALFYPSMVALRYNPSLQLLQQRLTVAGKPKMVIIGAAMRKLVHIIYGVLKNQTPFEASFSQNLLDS